MNPQTKPILGLTGFPGSGKSTVARLLAERGGGVIDADALARAALDESEVRKQIRERFGHSVFDPDGTPNRAELAIQVFADPEAKQALEHIVHPRVAAGRQRLHRQYASDPAVTFLVEDCPLLLETGLDKSCDRVLLIDTPRNVRLARLFQSRGWTDAQLAAREAAQWPLDTRRRLSHDVLFNGENRDILAPTLDCLLAQWGWPVS